MIKINTSMQKIGAGNSVYLLLPAEVVREFQIDSESGYMLTAYFKDDKLHLELEHDLTLKDD